MFFQLWSHSSEKVLKDLKPNLGFRNWAALAIAEKKIIWQHLDNFFFNSAVQVARTTLLSGTGQPYYDFTGTEHERKLKLERIVSSISNLSQQYKSRNYAPTFLANRVSFNACKDFLEIFTIQTENVVLELLSLYAKSIIQEPKTGLYKYPDETEELYKQRIEKEHWFRFDDFATSLNEIFSQFGLNYHLTRSGLIPKQDEKITIEVFVPVLRFFSNSKWKSVNQDLAEAFAEFRKHTPQGYSTCITKTVSSLQAFLQITVNGTTGKGDIAALIKQAQNQNLIPNDAFSKTIFSNVLSILMQERQSKGDAHPKEEFATEKNALMVLNISMVFFQHSIL